MRKHGNLLLCTLLLGNVAVNAALSILMADVTSGLVGFFVSTGVIVVFGEIIPQATCSRFPLFIGSRSIPVVRVFMLILLPLTWPLAKMLDYMLGKEVGDFYDPDEFDTLIRKHAENSVIDSDPARIMQGALRLSGKNVKDIMTPRSEMFSLKSTARLDYDTMAEIFRQGYSRVPVVDAEDEERVLGMLYAKDLMLIVPAKATPIATVIAFFHRESVTSVNGDDKVDVAFKNMLASKRHIAMVKVVDDSDGTKDPVLKLGGVITLEDIIETILQADLTDEYDGTDAGTTSAMGNAQLRGLTDVSDGFNDLDTSMVSAVTAHLITNVAAFRKPHPRTGSTLSLESVSELVQGSRVVELVVPDGVRPCDAEPIYTRGELEDVCSVILDGEVEVVAGEDDILVVRSTYDVLAQKAVLSAEYRSDFTARPKTRSVRILRITRNAVEEAFRIGRARGPGGIAGGDAGIQVGAPAAAKAAAPARPADAGAVSPGARSESASRLIGAAAAPPAAAAAAAAPLSTDPRGRSSSLPRTTPSRAAFAGQSNLDTSFVTRQGIPDAGLLSRYTIPKRRKGRAGTAEESPSLGAAPTPSAVPAAMPVRASVSAAPRVGAPQPEVPAPSAPASDSGTEGTQAGDAPAGDADVTVAVE